MRKKEREKTRWGTKRKQRGESIRRENTTLIFKFSFAFFVHSDRLCWHNGISRLDFDVVLVRALEVVLDCASRLTVDSFPNREMVKPLENKIVAKNWKRKFLKEEKDNEPAEEWRCEMWPSARIVMAFENTYQLIVHLPSPVVAKSSAPAAHSGHRSWTNAVKGPVIGVTPLPWPVPLPWIHIPEPWHEN